MKHLTYTCLLVLVIGLAPTAFAGDYDLSWNSIDGGGAMISANGGFLLSGTIGQHDASTTVMTGGDFELIGGFWAVTSEPSFPADLDGDGDVDLSDLADLLGRYGSCTGDPIFNPAADFDASGCIDLPDLAYLLGYYGTGT